MRAVRFLQWDGTPAVTMERKQSPATERSNRTGRTEAGARPRRSGEGSQSALASLRSIERDRARTSPGQDGKPRK
jgi:hypothetical protein